MNNIRIPVEFLPISEVLHRRRLVEDQNTSAELFKHGGGTDDESYGRVQAILAERKTKLAIREAREALVLAYCQQYRIDPETASFIELAAAERAAAIDAAVEGHTVDSVNAFYGALNDCIDPAGFVYTACPALDAAYNRFCTLSPAQTLQRLQQEASV